MNDFTTIKVRQHVRRWLKEEAAKNDVPMYQLVETLMVAAHDGVAPWPKPSNGHAEPALAGSVE
jgi:hypothetical protein